MSNKISLKINNLGIINNANLELGKLNVIVGKNGTGKSTSSKFLYCLLTASSKDSIYLANQDIVKRYINFISYWSTKILDDDYSPSSQINEIYSLLDENNYSLDFDKVYFELKKISENFTSHDIKKNYLTDLETINDLAKINKNLKIRHISTFNLLLNSEYGSSLRNNDDTKIKFYGDIDGDIFNQEILITNKGKNWSVSNEYLTYFNFKNIIYIDSPSILDIDNNTNNQIHCKLLNQKLKTSSFNVYDDEANKNVNEFKKRVDDLIDGKFSYDNKSKKFILTKDNMTFPMQNTASGLKQIGIIQMLLENNELTKDSFLIIDQPEMNLHPELQVKFAEILVLACKELNIQIYINTHSPFIAEAIEVYSKYYKLYDETKFYLTEPAGNNKYNYNLIEDIDIMKVYINLGNPFDIINSLRIQLDLNGD